jgi:hypothetical protein
MSELASSDVVDLLDADVATEKRAQWEAFEFTVLGDGDVEVVNDSHADADDHTYTVHVESGIPSDCTCPAWEFQPGACKHMVAVAIRDPVLDAATDAPTARTDGGTTVDVATETDTSDESDSRPDDCDCGDWNDGLDLPCWPCYREGFETPAGTGDDE